MTIFLIVNAIISILADIVFIVFMASKGYETCWHISGSDPDIWRQEAYKPIRAIKNGIISAIPIVNIILLLIFGIGYLTFNHKDS